MKKLILALIAIAISTAAVAQQPAQPDINFLQKIIAIMQAQRNTAMDNYASVEARAAILNEELAKAQARIKELEAKKEEKK